MHLVVPRSSLQPFIGQLWASTSAGHAPGAREHVLPTGQMHMVFRLAGPALRVYADAADSVGSAIAAPVVGGPRSTFYVKEMAAPVVSVGVQLLPGAAQALFGVSAAELAGRHVALSELWGSTADSVLQQLSEQPDPMRRLALLETLLAARLPPQASLHPAVARALASAGPASIGQLAGGSGYSHRGFIALFRHATGMSPKGHARLMRFQALLAAMRREPAASLSALAHAAGYSDQAHMTREFRAFAGVTPSQYRLLGPPHANHVPLAAAP